MRGTLEWPCLVQVTRLASLAVILHGLGGCSDDPVAIFDTDAGDSVPGLDGSVTRSDSGRDVDSGLRSDAGPEVPVDLPGFIDGVEPESHSHHPPMIDGNGNLYRLTESPASDGNNPRMMRSTNSGANWMEVDADNRPSARDLEGCWQLQVGTSIYVSVANSNHVWFHIFNTSDAPERGDQWVHDERVITELGNSGGVVQFSSLARTSDGQIWLFHSGTRISDRHQLGYIRRSASGEWGERQTLGETSGSWTGPRPVVGARDVTHVFYKDFLENRLHWRTLNPSGELSSPTRVDAAGTSDERIPQTNAVYYDADGREVIVIAYADGRGRLRAVTIVDGEVSDDMISPDRVLEDPNVAANDGTVAHLSVDGTTVHALWSDLASGDLLHSTRTHGGTWSTPSVVWDSGDNIAWWVYGNVYERGGRRRLGYTYTVGPHEDDVGHIEYDEITLEP